MKNILHSRRSVIILLLFGTFLVCKHVNCVEAKEKTNKDERPFIDMNIDFEENRRKVMEMDKGKFFSHSDDVYIKKQTISQSDCSRRFLSLQARILKKIYARLHSRLKIADTQELRITLTVEQVSKLNLFASKIQDLAEGPNETLKMRCSNYEEMSYAFDDFFYDLYIDANSPQSSASSSTIQTLLLKHPELWLPLVSFVFLICYSIKYRPSIVRFLSLLFTLLLFIYLISLVQYFKSLYNIFIEKETENCGLKHQDHTNTNAWSNLLYYIPLSSSTKKESLETPEQLKCIEENVNIDKFMAKFNNMKFLIDHWGEAFFGPLVNAFFFSFGELFSNLFGGSWLGKSISPVIIVGLIAYFMSPASLIATATAAVGSVFTIMNMVTQGRQNMVNHVQFQNPPNLVANGQYQNRQNLMAHGQNQNRIRHRTPFRRRNPNKLMAPRQENERIRH